MTTLPSRAEPAAAAWRARGTGAAARRLASIDALRGLALLGMGLFHGAWDLHAFGITAADPNRMPGWQMLGAVVAGTFLGLSGLGLGLALRQGVPPRRMALRLLRILLAALVVSAATWIIAPAAPVWFGILHCIVVTNAVALLLQRASTAVVLGLAFAAGMAPALWAGLPGPGWAWTGLAAPLPVTLDFRPVLPWLAPVLAGMAVGRHLPATRSPLSEHLPAWLTWAGRHSLALYLIHQPAMVVALILLTSAMPARDEAAETLRQPAQAAAFLQQCEASCRAGGGEPDLCRSTCHCVLTGTLARNATPSSEWAFLSGRRATDLDAATAACRSHDTRVAP